MASKRSKSTLRLGQAQSSARTGLTKKPRVPQKIEFDRDAALEAFNSLGSDALTTIEDEEMPNEGLGYSTKHEKLVGWLTELDADAFYELAARNRGKTLLTDDIILKAQIALKMGASEDEAAHFAELSTFRWRDMKKKYPNFARAIETWKMDLSLWARIGIANLIKSGDPKALMWYAERKMRDEYGARLQVDSNKTVTHKIGPLDMGKVEALKKAIPIPYELEDESDEVINAETGKVEG